MAPRLQRCASCKVHILEDATSCPFCSFRLPVKGLVATAAGVVVLVAGIGCAYGCPDAACSGGAYGGSGGTGASGETGGMAGAGGTGSGINDAGSD